MNVTLTIPTDGARFTVFDPEVAASWDQADLTQFDLNSIRAIQERLLFGFSVGSDGVYTVRITDSDLTDAEKDYALGHLPDLGMKVESGLVSVSGYGFQGTDEDSPSVSLERGHYSVEVYEIKWTVCADWRTEDDRPHPDAPPDFVFVISKLPNSTPENTAPLPDLSLETEYLPFLGELSFLFPSTTRKVGTQPGTVLVSTVIKSVKSPQEYWLKSSGIEGYKADLDTYEGLEWHDRVRFRVLEVDHQAMRYKGQFIERLPKESTI